MYNPIKNVFYTLKSQHLINQYERRHKNDQISTESVETAVQDTDLNTESVEKANYMPISTTTPIKTISNSAKIEHMDTSKMTKSESYTEEKVSDNIETETVNTEQVKIETAEPVSVNSNGDNTAFMKNDQIIICKPNNINNANTVSDDDTVSIDLSSFMDDEAKEFVKDLRKSSNHNNSDNYQNDNQYAQQQYNYAMNPQQYYGNFYNQNTAPYGNPMYYNYSNMDMNRQLNYTPATMNGNVNDIRNRPDFGRHKVDYPKQKVQEPVKIPKDTEVSLEIEDELPIKVVSNPSKEIAKFNIKDTKFFNDSEDVKKDDEVSVNSIITNLGGDKVEPISEVVSSFHSHNENILSNTCLNGKKAYLRNILEIFENAGHIVKLETTPDFKIIHFYVFNRTEPYQLCIERSFSIDTGIIIDRRVKVYNFVPNINNPSDMIGFEFNLNPYYAMTSDSKKNGKQSGKGLDYELFKRIAEAGFDNVSSRTMYTRDVMIANYYVDLSSISNNIDNANKEVIRNRIINIINKPNNILKSIKSADPTIRFKIDDYNSETKTFILDSKDVSTSYNSFTASMHDIRIVVDKDTETVISSNF